MSESLFAVVKPTCVGLLGSSSLTSSSVPDCLSYLNELVSILRIHSSELPQISPSLISYIFFPVSSILQRNAPSAIPDQIMEKIFDVVGLLSESWWWHCEIAIWEQIFMLCGSVLGGAAGKGKGKERDDEVKEAAGRCLYALLRERDDGSLSATKAEHARSRLDEYRNYARSPHFVPILGQMFNAIITTSESRSFPLQKTSLKAMRALLELYAPDEIFPMVLPGVVSAMSRVALGTKLEKQWANGEIVADALFAMRITIVRAIGDNICIREGALHNASDLEELAELVAPSANQPPQGKSDPPNLTKRTPSWLKGTTAQLHIAINNLNTLSAHPSPIALRALASFAGRIMEAASQTLPQTQPLLLGLLLSISNSSFSSVSSEARAQLALLLSDSSRARSSLVLTLMRNTSEYLSALPRLVSTREETKVQHVAALIRAVCNLASTHDMHDTEDDDIARSRLAITRGIGKLLGPSGGVEKWGWSLLSVLKFSEASTIVLHTSYEQLMLENDPDSPKRTPFPGLKLKTSENDTLRALEQMFRALGSAGGESCFHSVEWFFRTGIAGVGNGSVAAMWCACRLLEGVSGNELSSETSQGQTIPRTTRRLERLARALARALADLWDQQVGDAEDIPPSSSKVPQDVDGMSLIEHKQGLDPVHENLRIIRSSPAPSFETLSQPINHRVITLQLLSVCTGILQSRSSSLFIHILYPVLHSLISKAPFLASTAYASLQFMTTSSSYASPANLLLSNFDYALDAISRRLSRRWLDVDATQVLAMLVRLVGSDVVEKAGDVVEECFDRLDEFHGYDILVEGLVNVLAEVSNVLKDEVSPNAKQEKESVYVRHVRVPDLSAFFEWFRKRHEHHAALEDETYNEPAARRGLKHGDEKAEVEDQQATADSLDSGGESPTSTQVLVNQIVSRSLYFLTHGSPMIRAQILALLTSSVSNLSASDLMPAIHSAWPFILNRLSDQETFVVSAAASLIEALSTYMGEFMFRRIWDDVWPRFKTLLSQLQAGDAMSALVRRSENSVGTESAYTHSHRLYRSVLHTITAAVRDVRPHEGSFWDVLILFRQFLNQAVHPQLQQSARKLYHVAMAQDADLVWLVLTASWTRNCPTMEFLYNEKWDIAENVRLILGNTTAE